MKYRNLAVLAVSFFLAVSGLAQDQLNMSPSLALGNPPGVSPRAPKTSQPNLVEGRELNAPQSVAVDTDSGALYVADTGNNRVLAWRDARNFANGAFADLVIGQKDFFSTAIGGPGTSLQSGLNQPTALAVDAGGNLFVVDAGNNRILRYNRPFEQTQSPVLASLVLGQPNLGSGGAHAGGLSAKSIDTTQGKLALRSALAFDGKGNLWFSDAGNNRVLRYPASALGAGAANWPNADMVLGQPDFQTAKALARTGNNRLVKTGYRMPSGLALDASGRLYVADDLNRVVVYEPPYFSSKPASRVMGIVVVQQGGTAPSVINDRSLGVVAGNTWFPPEGVFTIGDIPFVIDTPAHRILRFAPFDQWSPEDPINPSPAAVDVIGQDSLNSDAPVFNRGRVEPGPDTLSSPVGAAVGFGKVFVADSANNRVLVFPDLSDGGPASKAEHVLGQTDFPHRTRNLIEGREFFFVSNQGAAAGLAIDHNSDPPHLYVADPNNNRVLGFRDARRVRNGTRADIVLGQVDMSRSLVNSPANDPGKPGRTGLFFPVDVLVDAAGNLYVADAGNSRVVRFPKPFEQPPGAQEADLVLGQFDFTSRITDATSRTMASPAGLAMTPEGQLLVSDSTHNRVLLFAPPFANGKAASRVFGQPDESSTGSGNARNRMKSPRGIALDPGHRLYVCDTNNNRVLIFSDIRAPVGDPSAALVISGLSSPRDVYIDSTTGESWITDTNRGFVRKYPRFDIMGINGANPIRSIPETGPLAVTEDSFGNLYVADAFNRVVAHFPVLRVVNAASFLPRNASRTDWTKFPGRVAPGMYSSVFFWVPKPIDTMIFNQLPNPLPMPRELADVQVLVNGEPAPLHFVSARQINFLMPNDAPTSGFVEVVVIRPSTLQILASNLVPADVASPAFFTRSQTGTGQIAALNQDNTFNSESNPARPGEVVQLFGTGAGHISGAPPDGEVATGLTPTPVMPVVFVNSSTPLPESDIQYSGLAPSLVGVWQVNIKLPQNLPDGNIFVIAFLYDRPSGDPTHPGLIVTTVAVKR